MFEDYDENKPVEEEELPAADLEEGEAAAEGSNRTFLYIIIGAVALILIAIIALVAYVMMNRNGGESAREQRETEISKAYVQQTEIAFAQIATERAAAFTQVPTFTASPQPTATPRPATNTPVVAVATSTDVGAAPTLDARMVTLTALYSQLTQSALTPLAPTTTAFATALPDTGMFDNFGVPQLFALAGLALIVIYLVRRLRSATS